MSNNNGNGRTGRHGGHGIGDGFAGLSGWVVPELERWRARHLDGRGRRFRWEGVEGLGGLPVWEWGALPAWVEDDPAAVVLAASSDRGSEAGAGGASRWLVAWSSDVEALDVEAVERLRQACASWGRLAPGSRVEVEGVERWRSGDWGPMVERVRQAARVNVRPADPTARVAGDGWASYGTPSDVVASYATPGGAVGCNLLVPREVAADGRELVPGGWVHRPVHLGKLDRDGEPVEGHGAESVVWCRWCRAVGSSRSAVEHQGVKRRAGENWHGAGVAVGVVDRCPAAGSSDPGQYRGGKLPAVFGGPDAMSGPDAYRRVPVSGWVWRFDPSRVGDVRSSDGGTRWAVGDGWHRVRVDRVEWRGYSLSRSIALHGRAAPLRVPDVTPDLRGRAGATFGGQGRAWVEVERPDGLVEFVAAVRSIDKRVRVRRVPWVGVLDHWAVVLDRLGGAGPVLSAALPVAVTLNADGSLPRSRGRRSTSALRALGRRQGKRAAVRSRVEREAVEARRRRAVPDVLDREAWEAHRAEVERQARELLDGGGAIG